MPDAVSVRQVSSLPRASFRFHLTMDTLASSYALGATPCARDFHPLERAHAEHTEKRADLSINPSRLEKILFRSPIRTVVGWEGRDLCSSGRMSKN